MTTPPPPRQSALRVLVNAFAHAFSKEPVVPVSEWSDRHAYFRDVGGAVVKWSTDRAPYSREIMDFAQDLSVSEITIKMCEQMGKTEILQRIVQSAIDQEPTRIQIVYPNDRVAKNQIKKKLLPAMRLTPRTLARMAGSRKTQDALTLEFDRTEIQTTGSNSPANVEGFAFGLSIVDELDRCEPDTEERIEGRGSALARAVRIKASTPTSAGEGIDRSFARGDRRRYYVPCPHCGRYDFRRLDDVRWPGTLKNGQPSDRTRDLGVPEHHAQEHAYIVCRHCRGHIHHSHNQWQLRLGVWVPEGCEIGTLTFATGVDGREPRSPVAPQWSGATKNPAHRSYELTGLYRCFPAGVNPYGRMAAGLVRFKGSPTAEWINRRMGLAFSPQGESADEATLRAARTPIDQGGFRLGTVPNWAIMLVQVSDVQPNNAWSMVMALGPGDDPDGQRCALVWCENVPCPGGLGLGPVERLAQKTFFRQDGTTLRVIGEACDSGHRPEEVYKWGRSGGRHRVVMRGVGGNSGRGGMAELIRWSAPERRPDGHVRPDSVKVLRVNSPAWKQAAVAMMLHAGPRRPGPEDPESMLGGGGMRLFLPADTPEDWISQATAEQLTTLRRGGAVQRVWRMKSGRHHNHYFDCLTYFLAFCHAKGAAELRDPRAAPQPNTAHARGPRKTGAMF